MAPADAAAGPFAGTAAALSRLRGKRVLHPHGVAVRGNLTPLGKRLAGTELGTEHEITARLSRSVGLPDRCRSRSDWPSGSPTPSAPAATRTSCSPPAALLPWRTACSRPRGLPPRFVLSVRSSRSRTEAAARLHLETLVDPDQTEALAFDPLNTGRRPRARRPGQPPARTDLPEEPGRPRGQ